MVILLISLENINMLIVPIVLMVLNFNAFDKATILNLWRLFIINELWLFSFYTNSIAIIIFSTLSLSLLILSQIINEMTPVGQP